MMIYFFYTFLVSLVIVQVGVAFPFSKYDGTLEPGDLNLCVDRNVTFNCSLLDDPKPNKTILFFVNSPSDIAYLPANEDDIIFVNETVSQLRVHVSESGYTTVKCFYSTSNDGEKPSRSDQLGETTTLIASNPSDPKIVNFSCIVHNFVETMNCSWQYEGYSEQTPNVTFDWQIQVYSGYQHCQDLDPVNRYCFFKSTLDGDFSTKIIDIMIILSFHTCGENRVGHHSFNRTVDTRKIVKPNPIDGLRWSFVNSTCVKLDWNGAKSRPEYPKEQEIIVSSKWNTTTVTMNTTYTNHLDLHSRMFCGLEEYTDYTFSIKIKPLGPDYGGFWSEERSIKVTTGSAAPSASPGVVPGGYSWNPQVCKSEGTRKVCFMIQSIPEVDKNGKIKGLRVQYKSKTSEPMVDHLADESTYFCKHLSCLDSYKVVVSMYNNFTMHHNISMENMSSTIAVEKWSNGIVQPQLKVERLMSTENRVHLQWKNPRVPNTVGYYLFSCLKSQGGCEWNGDVNWEFYPADTLETYMDINSVEMSFGVSLVTGTGSSGLQWETCMYTRGACPSKTVKNVFVSAGAEDDTLVVDWDKLQCMSGEPFISSYIVTYCVVDNGPCKFQVVDGEESRVVLYNLVKEYSVQVAGVSDTEDCEPHYSDAVRGTPEHRALRSGAIVGIVMSSLVVVMMAGVGVFCCIRKSRARYTNWKESVGAVKLPAPLPTNYNNSELMNSSLASDQSDKFSNPSFSRQDSNDSGVPATPQTEGKKPDFRIFPEVLTKIEDKINETDENDVDKMNLRNKENNNKIGIHDENVIGMLQGNVNPSFIEMTDMSKGKDIVLPDGYRKATIASTPVQNRTSEDHSQDSADANRDDTNVVTDVEHGNRKGRTEILELRKIPVPQCCNSPVPDYMELSPATYVGNQTSSNGHSERKEVLGEGADSYVKAVVGKSNDIDQVGKGNNPQGHPAGVHGTEISPTSAPYVQSPIRYSGNTPSVTDSYVQSPLQYDNDGRFPDNSDTSLNSEQTSNPYVSSIGQNADECSNPSSASNSSKTPSEQSQVTSYVKTVLENDAGNPTAATISDYVQSPIHYDDNSSTMDCYNGPDITSSGPSGVNIFHQDNNSDAYVTSPVIYGDTNPYTDNNADDYVTSPTLNVSNDISTYITSPALNSSSNKDTDVPLPTKNATSDSGDYVFSPSWNVTSDINTYVTSPSLNVSSDINTYVTSPSQNVFSDVNTYVTSPSLNVFSDINTYVTSPSLNVTSDINTYVRSPIQNVTSDRSSYVASLVQYREDNAPSDNTASPYVMSPIQYDSEKLNPDSNPPLNSSLTSDLETYISSTKDGFPSHENTNVIPTSIAMSSTVDTPYVDIKHMEMLDQGIVSPVNGSEDKPVDDATKIETSANDDGSSNGLAKQQLPGPQKQDVPITSGYITFNAALQQNNDENQNVNICGLENNVSGTQPSDYIDSEKMKLLDLQLIESERRLQNRTKSSASESSSDSGSSIGDSFKEKMGHYSDSGLSSLETA